MLAAAQAGSFDEIIEKDLLTDDLVTRVNSLLKKSKQQTVAGSRAHQFIQQRASLTTTTLDQWLQALRAELLKDIDDAKQANPGKEITLLLKAADDD